MLRYPGYAEVWSFEVGDILWLRWHPLANVLLCGTADSEMWMWKIPGGNLFSDIRNIDIDMLLTTRNQCCGCGFWIRCLFELWIRDPKWVKNQDPDPG